MLFSIGHSNHPLEKFLALLKSQDIEVLADVRSQPHSRYSPHFNADRLNASLAEVNVSYLSLGQKLGGRPADKKLYDAAGHVMYDRVAATDLFRTGIEQLEQTAAQHRVAMMCSEEDPTRCHRFHLITPAILAHGVEVLHLRGDGRLQTDEELRAAQQSSSKNRQQQLFAN